MKLLHVLLIFKRGNKIEKQINVGTPGKVLDWAT